MTVPAWSNTLVMDIIGKLQLTLCRQGPSPHERGFDILTLLAYMEMGDLIVWLVKHHPGAVDNEKAAQVVTGWINNQGDIHDLIDKYVPDRQENNDVRSGDWQSISLKLAAYIICQAQGVGALYDQGDGTLGDSPALGGAQTPLFEFVDVADTYGTTVIWDWSSEEVFIGSMGGAVEAWESEQAEDAAEETEEEDGCTLSTPDDFDGYDGTFYDFRYHDPADEDVPDRGDPLYMSYGNVGDGKPSYTEGWEWFMPNYVSGSDYSGGTVARSNYEVLLERAQELDADPDEVPDDCRPWFINLSGGYSTYALVFHVNRTPEDIRDMLDGLANYPVIDDEHHSNLENELEDEAWQSTYRDDYERALEEAFGAKFDHLYKAGVSIDLNDAEVDEHFYEYADSAAEYWEHSAEGPYINVEKVAKHAADQADSVDDLPKGAKLEGKLKKTGDRMVDFFFPPPDDDGSSGEGGGFLHGLESLSGNVIQFPQLVRENQLDLDLISASIINIQDFGGFLNEPGPHDIYALIIEYWRFELDQDEPDLRQVAIGYTHNPSYAQEVAEALFNTLDTVTSFAGVFVITKKGVVFSRVKNP